MTAPRRHLSANPPGRLPAAMLRAVAAEVSDPGRFSRAKAYARDGAVFDIEIESGEARGLVQGSRYEPYLATVYAAPADDLDSLLGAVPEAAELMATCTCPDDGPGGFCKHALATLLVIADEITADPAVLSTWRSGQRHPALPARTDAATIDVLATWLRAPAPIPGPATLPARVPVAVPGHPDLARCLADALAILRAG